LKGHFLSGGLVLLALLGQSAQCLAQELDEVVASDLRGRQTGLVMAIYAAGEIGVLQAFGSPTPNREKALSADQIFPFPALTEVLIGITIEALADAEVLALDAPISRYLSGLSPRLGQITLDQLLTHTGGLDDAQVREDQTWADALDELRDWALVTEPGAVYSRSRYSFPLAMRVVEEAVGEPFADIATAAVLGPLTMESSTFDLDRAKERGLIDGLGVSTSSESPFLLIAAKSESQGLPVLFTTAEDVTRLLAAWMTAGIRGTPPWARTDSIPVPNPTEFRAGVHLDEFQGHLRVDLTTPGMGFGAGFYMFPEAKIGLMVWGTFAVPGRTALFAQERIISALPAGQPDTPEASDTAGSGPEPEPSSADGIPPHAVGWSGEYRNGEEKVELRQMGEGLAYIHGTDVLELASGPGGRMTVLWSDGRATSMTFRLLLDRKGRRYVLRGTGTSSKAFLHKDDAPPFLLPSVLRPIHPVARPGDRIQIDIREEFRVGPKGSDSILGRVPIGFLVAFHRGEDRSGLALPTQEGVHRLSR
jgi:CubicO group peptidase (beta-lactamase class C family)